MLQSLPLKHMGNTNEETQCQWAYLPYPALFKIFQYLDYKELLRTGEVCRFWFQASRDEFLWKQLFYTNFNVDRSVPVVAGKFYLC